MPDDIIHDRIIDRGNTSESIEKQRIIEDKERFKAAKYLADCIIDGSGTKAEILSKTLSAIADWKALYNV